MKSVVTVRREVWPEMLRSMGHLPFKFLLKCCKLLLEFLHISSPLVHLFDVFVKISGHKHEWLRHLIMLEPESFLRAFLTKDFPSESSGILYLTGPCGWSVGTPAFYGSSQDDRAECWIQTSRVQRSTLAVISWTISAKISKHTVAVWASSNTENH